MAKLWQTICLAYQGETKNCETPCLHCLRIVEALARDQAERNNYGISDEGMLGRAVRGARSREYRKGQKHYRWVAVMDLFSLGSTAAHDLCRRFDLDPDEYVRA